MFKFVSISALLVAAVAMPAHAGVVSRHTMIEAPCQVMGHESEPVCAETTVVVDAKDANASITFNGSAARALIGKHQSFSSFYDISLARQPYNDEVSIMLWNYKNDPVMSGPDVMAEVGRSTQVMITTHDGGKTWSDPILN